MTTLNNLHPALKFTRELEANGVLPFLDVKAKRDEDKFVTTIYRKPTFTGLYIPFDSFTPFKYKRNLMNNLCDRATQICSPSELEEEIDFLKETFLKNGYPSSVVKKYVVPHSSKHENRLVQRSVVLYYMFHFLALPPQGLNVKFGNVLKVFIWPAE